MSFGSAWSALFSHGFGARDGDGRRTPGKPADDAAEGRDNRQTGAEQAEAASPHSISRR